VWPSDNTEHHLPVTLSLSMHLCLSVCLSVWHLCSVYIYMSSRWHWQWQSMRHTLMMCCQCWRNTDSSLVNLSVHASSLPHLALCCQSWQSGTLTQLRVGYIFSSSVTSPLRTIRTYLECRLLRQRIFCRGFASWALIRTRTTSTLEHTIPYHLYVCLTWTHRQLAACPPSSYWLQ